jgi:hypothetical protein
MLYKEWNSIIAEHFFNPKNAGKYVLFYLDKKDVINLGRPYLSTEADEEIWNDFIHAIRYNGQLNTKGMLKPHLPVERPIKLFEKWNKTDTPPFIAYLTLYIIPLTETYEKNFNANNYYDRVNEFFFKNGILVETKDDCIGTNNFKKISYLWDELEEWSILTKDGELGIFEIIKKFHNPRWKYVSKPLSLCIFPPKAIKKLPELFYEAGLIPNSSYSNDEFVNILVRYGGSMLGINGGVLELIKKSSSDEFGQAAIKITRREYENWTGESHQQRSIIGTPEQTTRNYTVASLLLQFKINDNEGTIDFSYRMYSINDYPEDLKIGEFENIDEGKRYSKTLKTPFKESFELKDEFNKWTARFPEREIRLFINAGLLQLSNQYWIETDKLSKTDRMFLLCRNEKRQSIIDWGKHFDEGCFKEDSDLDGLPKNYSLFKILNPRESLNKIPILTVYSEKSIQLIDGLKINTRAFQRDFLPDVEIKNADGREDVYLHYKGDESRHKLTNSKRHSNRWHLPDDILLDRDFYIKINGGDLSGYDYAYIIRRADGSTFKIDNSKLPKRDAFDRRTENNELAEFAIGNCVSISDRSRQEIYKPNFTSINDDFGSPNSVPMYVNEAGNVLISFLTLKGRCTTEEFFKAFEFLNSKYFPDRPLEESNYSKIKKRSLNLYDYLGYVDYDYEKKEIVTALPQFVFLPTKKGRTVLLIGGRDALVVNKILEIAPKHHLQVEIKKQHQRNENLMLPDVITIKAFGKATENFGEKNLKAFADELNIKFINEDFLQVGLALLSSDIDEYEKNLLEKNKTSKDDYCWARKLFNHDTLTYEKNESESFDKTFSLVEYKLNEYTYLNKLWIDGECYLVDKNWGKYLMLKHYDVPPVILYDKNKEKIAIPVELPLPRLLTKSIVLMSGFAPVYLLINSKPYWVYENISSLFINNLILLRLKQKKIECNL